MRRARHAAWCLLAGLGAAAALHAQHPAPPPTPPAAAQKRGSASPPTHAPLPTLPPAAALAHVRAGHAAWLAATRAGSPPPPPAERPAGAGRYVCAAIVCADADLDVPTLLGLRRSDVLLVSTPGPFVTPELIASLEQHVADERLPLVLVLTHERCTTLASKPGITPRQDALAKRIALHREQAERARQPLARSLALAHRESLLAASEVLQQRAEQGELRIVPGQVDAAGTIQWHSTRAEEMPLPPVQPPR